MIMKTLLLLLTCLGLACLAAPAAAAGQPDAPPANIIKHYEWCLLPKYRPDTIARMEGFWAKHHPPDEQYADAAQLRYVRRSAYRLADLYAAEGQKDKCREMLRWLEAHDNTLPRQ